MRRILLLAVVFALAGTATAQACSCVPAGDPDDDIATADAAVYGKVVKRVTNDGRFDAVRYRLKVIGDYKDNLGGHVSFKSNLQSAACGIDVAKGRKIALLLYRDGGRYTGSLCGIRSRKFFEQGAQASGRGGCAAQALA